MAVYEGVSPIQIDFEPEDQEEIENSEMLESVLANHVSNCWSKAKFAKQQMTERLLQCERQRRGEYDPERAMQIAQIGGSDIFMMITDIKCRAAMSWIKDVTINNSDRPFELEPSEQPMIPPEIRMSIIDFVRMEAEQFVAQGASLHPEAFRTRMEEVHDKVLTQLKEEAKDTARRMGDVIEDQLDQGNFNKAFEEFVDDFVTFPSAILKGPTVRKKKRLAWGPDFQPVVMTDFVREVERVSPFDIFPSPGSSGVDDGYLIQRHRLNASVLESFIGVSGYSEENIKQAILRYRSSGYRYQEYGDDEKEELDGKYSGSMYNDDSIEALEFWGKVGGDVLDGYIDDVEEHETYEVNVWVVGSYVIKAVVNPDPLGRRPYDIASWGTIPGSFWGTALPEIMRDVQVMCNAAARALANNMGIASGPQVEVHIDRLADGEDLTTMYPWKIWQTTTDRTGGGQPGVRFFQPDMNVAPLMNIYSTFMKQADEVTGIPNYIYGSAQSSGAGRTASGLSMLMDNAAKGIKQAVAYIDKVVSGVVSRLYTHNMIYNPDPYIKGDFRVVAKGSMGLIAKEQLQMRRNEFLQATANPMDMQILGPMGRAYILREIARGLQMDTDKIVPSIEELKAKEQAAKEEQMMLQEQMAQQQAMQQGMPQEGAPPDDAQMRMQFMDAVNRLAPSGEQ